MGDTDSELLGRCAAGEAAALETLYRRYVDRVWRFGWLRTHSREAAADIVQETFLRVARSAGDFQGRSSFATWLFALTRSAAVDHARREGRHRAIGQRPGVLRLVPSADDATDRIDDRQRDAVRRAVADLPCAQRDAVVLCELLGWKVREAADVLGWGESRVKVTLFRARRRLRDVLKGYLAKQSDTGRVGASR